MAKELLIQQANFFRSQLFTSLPYPSTKFTNQTIIVTGSNTGLGLEAARHFVRLDAGKVILAVRSLSRGRLAAENIAASEGRPEAVEVWELDLAKYDSVKSFARRAADLPRLDVVVANAGIYTFDFSTAEEDEATITVNVVSTMLLGLLLLPKLRDTAAAQGSKTVLTFTGSFVHYFTSFPERHAENIFDSLGDASSARMMDRAQLHQLMFPRYNVSKMIQLLVFREFAELLAKSDGQGRVVTSIVNPGYVATDITREATGFWFKLYLRLLSASLSRTAEVGSRTLVHAAYGDDETFGQYLEDCTVGRTSSFVTSDEGRRAQKKLWWELRAKLEKIQPGVTNIWTAGGRNCHRRSFKRSIDTLSIST
ncbi:short-chain dehydrogenase reductase [Colletotrichum plurivorum]|uniref:Short-chain dehydrogenase reductase n=1 Tax=Colletotrichum plurivorum TaxID=2175906 RepID=A0A8H6K4Z5_9PEZI|nr:short-chain dehydrogenase reductase [Colletotrichum plurivorum]